MVTEKGCSTKTKIWEWLIRSSDDNVSSLQITWYQSAVVLLTSGMERTIHLAFLAIAKGLDVFHRGLHVTYFPSFGYKDQTVQVLPK